MKYLFQFNCENNTQAAYGVYRVHGTKAFLEYASITCVKMVNFKNIFDIISLKRHSCELNVNDCDYDRYIHNMNGTKQVILRTLLNYYQIIYIGYL